MPAIRIFRKFRDLLDVTFGAPADGDVAQYDLASDKIILAPAAAAGAPANADYLVGTAQAGLSAEIVVGPTPGGELGGTWAAPTVGTVHSGSSHAATQAAAEATAAAALAAHTGDPTDAHDASAISNVPAGDIAATDVQSAINELDSEKTGNVVFNDHSARHENGGADEITIAGLDGISVELAAHLADASDAHDASAISFVPVGTIAATDVQAAIAEMLSEAGSQTFLYEFVVLK